MIPQNERTARRITARNIARGFLVTILAVALAAPPPLAFACGPDFTGPTFVATAGPDFPISDYARGKLGLLQHTYHHEPLYIAYRNLSGKAFNDAEVKMLAEHSAATADAAAGPDSQKWQQTWRDRRAELLRQMPELHPNYYGEYGIVRELARGDSYIFYVNCLNNAFESAVQTLNQRAKQFGPQSPAVKDWIAAQDQVFENCSAQGYPPKPKPAVIPAAAHPEDPDVIRADRAYQIAAAHFYAEEFDEAQSGFEAIAKDPVSPYSKLAPYLVARALIRKGTIESGDGDYDPRVLSQAEAKLRAILADKDLAEMHDPAERLLGFVRIRLHREQRTNELEASLLNGDASKTFRQDLTDYLWLLDHPVPTKTVAPAAEGPGQSADKAQQFEENSRLKGSDMTDWIFTFQQGGDVALQHSLQRWQETKSLPWLVAALTKVSAEDKAAVDLSAAAAKITVDSPAFVTVAFHRLRLLEQSGKQDDARQQLDQLLAQHGANLSLSAKNEFLALRMKLATNLEEFLRFAPRISNDAEAYPNPPVDRGTAASETAAHFDADASVVLTNKLPLRLLADAAKSNGLPPSLRRDVVVAAWTRAILLNNEAVAQELAPTLQEVVPETKVTVAEYNGAADAASRRFAAVLNILRNPGFRPFVSSGYARGNLYTIGEPGFDRIDSLRDNWWCAFTSSPENQSYGDYFRMYAGLSPALREVYWGDEIPSPNFLTDDQRATATSERHELGKQLGAPNWLGKEAIDWAQAHPDDPRVPEALHLVVRARRYGCGDSGPENYSKAAFDLLHKRYPESEWTKKTPYWFQ
jgi:hypothetical protein